MFAFASHLKNLAVVDRMIRDGKNASHMAEAVDASTRTVHRYLDFFRKELNAPLEFDSKQNHFFYSGKWNFDRAVLRWLHESGK